MGMATCNEFYQFFILSKQVYLFRLAKCFSIIMSQLSFFSQALLIQSNSIFLFQNCITHENTDPQEVRAIVCYQPHTTCTTAIYFGMQAIIGTFELLKFPHPNQPLFPFPHINTSPKKIYHAIQYYFLYVPLSEIAAEWYDPHERQIKLTLISGIGQFSPFSWPFPNLPSLPEPQAQVRRVPSANSLKKSIDYDDFLKLGLIFYREDVEEGRALY